MVPARRPDSVTSIYHCHSWQHWITEHGRDFSNCLIALAKVIWTSAVCRMKPHFEKLSWYSTHIFFHFFTIAQDKDTWCKSTNSTRRGGWIKFYMLGSFLIKMQAARLATFIKSITCKTLTPSSRPLKVHWKYWSFVALKSDSSSQHPIVSHLWLFPLSSLWHYFLLFPSACSNQANFVITTILPVNQDIIFETKLFFWFEKSVFVLWGIKWWLLSVHTLSPHWNIVTAAQSSSPCCTQG